MYQDYQLFEDEYFLTNGTKVILSTGETFILDETMKLPNSCTFLDFIRFQEEGLIKELLFQNK